MTKNIDKRIIDKGFHTGHEVEYVTIQKSDYEYLKEQAERVQELERANKQLEKQAPGIELGLLNVELTDALKQNKRYRKALEEIRNYGTFELNNALKKGYAWIAHEALEEEEK